MNQTLLCGTNSIIELECCYDDSSRKKRSWRVFYLTSISEMRKIIYKGLFVVQPVIKRIVQAN